MIVLHDYWRSSASYRVRIALNLAGVEWQSLPVDLTKGEHLAPAHLERNRQGLVPALDMDGTVFTQSLAIIEYLEERFGLGLLPDDAASRAKVRALAYAIAMDIHPVCNLRVAKYAIAHSNGGITMESWSQQFITLGLSALETMVDDGDVCVGATVTLPDLCLVPQLYNARRWGVDLQAMPKLRRIGAYLEALPAFAAAHPDLTPH